MTMAFEDVVRGLHVEAMPECESCNDHPAQCRITTCGENEGHLLCLVCWDATFLAMLATLDKKLARDALPICGACGGPIPLLKFLQQHVRWEHLEA